MKGKATVLCIVLVILSIVAMFSSLAATAGNENKSILKGKVSDEDGVGIEKAIVIVESQYLTNFNLTDINGDYVIYDLAPGWYNITIIPIKKEGYITKTENIELKPGNNTYNTILTKGKPPNPLNDMIIFMLSCLGAGIIILGAI
ncbi:MAG: carboxypeptidase-like regulatory domain-containing protein, partial [Candidatus Thermoplasmatota archaeon]